MLDKPFLDIQKQVKNGISVLKQGGIVAFPTDTVYGLGACANLPQAVERVYKIKARPNNRALPLLLSDTSQIIKIADPVLPLAWVLIYNFLPGALTLVLPKSNSVPDIITAGGTTIAFRIPDHPIPLALIEGLESPVIGTSANLSGQPSSLTADEVYSQLGDKIDLIIDGGHCPGSRESTVVDVTGEIPVVLREGIIPAAMLEQVCGNIILKQDD